MTIYRCGPLRREFCRFVDAFRRPSCNETVRCVTVSRTLFVSLLIITTCNVLWAAWPQLPSNILRSNAAVSRLNSNFPYVPLSGANLLGLAFPQGWTFFAEQPNEDQYRVYARVGPTSSSSMDRPQYNVPKYMFGLDREPLQQRPELKSLRHQVRDDQWRSCASDDQCRNAAMQPIVVRNYLPNPTYCGPVTVIQDAVVPWAHRRLNSRPTIDSRVIRLDIQCIQD
jgi:antimicrobial peptide system SdpA family protein